MTAYTIGNRGINLDNVSVMYFSNQHGQLQELVVQFIGGAASMTLKGSDAVALWNFWHEQVLTRAG